jgi:glutathione S-transferase
MASAEEAADKKAAFLGELAKVEGYLAQHGPFFGGDKLDATDASMAPKMYHALTALGEQRRASLMCRQWSLMWQRCTRCSGMQAAVLMHAVCALALAGRHGFSQLIAPMFCTRLAGL